MSELVYLVRSGKTAGYKIGFTTDMDRRLKELNGTSAPFEATLFFIIEVINGKPIEASLHHKYKDYIVKRDIVKRDNEWFELTDKQVESVIQDMIFLQSSEQILYNSGSELQFPQISKSELKIIVLANQLESACKENNIMKITQIYQACAIHPHHWTKALKELSLEHKKVCIKVLASVKSKNLNIVPNR